MLGLPWWLVIGIFFIGLMALNVYWPEDGNFWKGLGLWVIWVGGFVLLLVLFGPTPYDA